MANRVAVWIDDRLVPINSASQLIRFSTGKPRRIGDVGIALFKRDGLPEEIKVMYIPSRGMVKDITYLVTTDYSEAWPYKLGDK